MILCASHFFQLSFQKMPKRGENVGSARHPRSVAFLLAQVGAHAARRFGERLAPLELTPAYAGILRAVATHSGISQQALASLLSMMPSRLVALLDELESRGLLERRDHAEDRRLYALYLTAAGSKLMSEVGRIARAHDDALCASLSEAERAQLFALLTRIAEQEQLTAGVHPGFARLGEGKRESSPGKPRAQ
jgi:DNA-binding MarR family transcriptional regulator